MLMYRGQYHSDVFACEWYPTSFVFSSVIIHWSVTAVIHLSRIEMRRWISNVIQAVLVYACCIVSFIHVMLSARGLGLACLLSRNDGQVSSCHRNILGSQRFLLTL